MDLRENFIPLWTGSSIFLLAKIYLFADETHFEKNIYDVDILIVKSCVLLTLNKGDKELGKQG